MTVTEDESSSDIQATKGSWCFIGEDNGIRMCARTDGNEWTCLYFKRRMYEWIIY